MPLGKESKLQLATCHPELIQLIELVAKGVDEGDLLYAEVDDISVLCGYRGADKQNRAFAEGASKTPWPKSKHNRIPSDAVDVVPFPIDWTDPAWVKKLDTLHAYIAGVAQGIGIDLYDISWDRPHIERKTT